MIFGQGQRIVMIGDSITDCGRRDTFAPYGNGYVSLVQAFITARYPDLALTWHNRGIGGNTVRDLAARWDEVAVMLAERFPKAAALMDGAKFDVIAFTAFPREH